MSYVSYSHQFFDQDNNPLSYGYLWTYESGTDTPSWTYKTVSGNYTWNPWPLQLDATGSATCFLDDNVRYTFNLTDINQVKQANYPVDHILVNNTATIHIYASFVISHSGLTVSYGAPGISYTFTPTVTADPPYASGPFTYHWDFGDGSTSTSTIPTHTYSSSGTYNITLSIGILNTQYSTALINPFTVYQTTVVITSPI